MRNLVLLIVILVSGINNISAQNNEKGELVITRFNDIKSNLFINKLFVDSKNGLWVASTEGLYYLTTGERAVSTFYEKMNIIDVAEAANGDIYLASGNQILKYPKPEGVASEIDNFKISSITVNGDKVVCGTNKGLYDYIIETGDFESYRDLNKDLKSKKVNFVHADSHGIVWAGTANGEVRIEGEKWKIYHDKSNVTNYKENDEGMWFYGDREMWLVDPWNRGYDVGLDRALYSGNINDFTIDSKGRLYVASDKMVRYDPYEEKIEKFAAEASILSQKCLAIATDKDDNVWIGTDGSGLYRLVFADIASDQLAAGILISNPLTCDASNNASIQVTVAGGTPPYTYQWGNKDLSGDKAENLGPGTYNLTVTDFYANAAVTEVKIQRPEDIKITLKETERVSAANRNDGKAIIEISGGKPPYKVNWSNGSKGTQIARLRAGDYTVNVVDENGCKAEKTITIPKEKYLPELTISKVIVGQKLRLNELYFEADSSIVTDQSLDVLKEVLDFLVENPGVSIEIGGHTNTIPPHEYCDKLSSDRASNVASYFYKKGFDENRITYKGYGKREPLTNDESMAGRARNQRVEIKILSI
jgi:outer membrane protein OmpA-like peptidoglycan-associated protein